jgi:hypothetical protein
VCREILARDSESNNTYRRYPRTGWSRFSGSDGHSSVIMVRRTTPGCWRMEPQARGSGYQKHLFDVFENMTAVDKFRSNDKQFAVDNVAHGVDRMLFG